MKIIPAVNNKWLALLLSLSLSGYSPFLLSSNEELKGTQASFIIDDRVINYKIEVLADRLHYPWSLAFLPDGDLLITERVGHLRRWHEGKLSEPVLSVPKVFTLQQGGLFDVVLHPEFSKNQRIFLSFAQGSKNQNMTRVIAARLINNQLQDIQVIFDVKPFKDTPVHYGGRMVILPDNTLLLTTGDGFDYREKAQDLSGLLGKIIRINLDGSIPEDNPFVGNNKALNEIWSYGHRNPQGLIYDPQRKKVFMHEHGPQGGDEINLIEKGLNYGWPVITYGIDYSGASITPFTEYEGMQQPLLYWVPSIAPSGMAVYYGEQFPELSGDFLVGALVDREVRLVRMKNNKPVDQISLFKELNTRIRDVRVGLDGAIYLLTDSDNGQLLRVSRLTK